MSRTSITLSEAAAVCAICFGLAIAVSVHAMLDGFPEQPFTDSAFLYMLFLEIVLGGVALVYLRMRGFDIRTLLPQPGLAGAGVGAGLYLSIWILGAIVVSPFAGAYAMQPIHRMVMESTPSLPVVVTFGLVNGAFEEIFLLGVLVRGLRSCGLSIAIGFPLLVRVSCHLYQGPVGALWIQCSGPCLRHTMSGTNRSGRQCLPTCSQTSFRLR